MSIWRKTHQLIAYWCAVSTLLVLWRLIATGIRRLTLSIEPRGITLPPDAAAITVLVPVFNEQSRLAPCLEGLLQQSMPLQEILVIDTGSTDRTRELIAAYAARDHRVRLLAAGEPPEGVNGKSWALIKGIAAAQPNTTWFISIDADVRPAPEFVARLIKTVTTLRVEAASVALTQVPGWDALSWLLHPAMLASIIYRIGIPGRVDNAVNRAFINGQAFVLHRSAIQKLDGLRPVQNANAEDVAIARLLTRADTAVAFLASIDETFVVSYPDARAVWSAWPRSLPLTDHQGRIRTVIDLAVLVGSQGLWLPLLLLSWSQRRQLWPALFATMIRLGVLIGMREAYQRPAPLFWFSPLLDPIVVLRIVQAALAGDRRWRGRMIQRRGN